MDLSQPSSRAKSILFCRGNSDSPNEADAAHSDGRKEMKPTEDFLSSEMSKLSLQERSKAMDDLHCVGEELEESPEMIQQKLKEFDEVVQQGNYPKYSQAAKQNRAFVEDSSFRLMFLRANSYDAKKSAQQMVNHLHQKAQYFGEDKLGRDINFDDLTSEDIEVMLTGFLHVQADRDRTGRGILCAFSHLLSRWNDPSCPWTIGNIIRVHYYLLFNILLTIPDVQTKGLVVIYYDSESIGNRFSMPSFHDLASMKDYRSSIPIRYSAVHLCLKRQTQGLVFKNNFFEAVLKNMTRYARVRTRVHYGSHIETKYSLRTYGIPNDTHPVDADGNISTEVLNAWFFKLLEEIGREDLDPFAVFSKDDQEFPIDSTFGFPDVVDSADQEAELKIQTDAVPNAENIEGDLNNKASIDPSQQDILLGRGVRLMQHPGNIRFREYLEGYQDEYDQAQRNKRRKVTSQVVQGLNSKGVRFLERNEEGTWVESDSAEAETKVAQSFRSRRKAMKKT